MKQEMFKARFVMYVHSISIIIGCLCLVFCNDNHTQIELYKKKGQSFYDRGLYKEAIESWEKATALSRGNRDLYFQLAKAYQHLAKFDFSTKYLNQIIDENKNDFDAQLMIVQNHIFLGNFKAAKAFCDKIEAMFPDHYSVMMLKRDIALFMGLFEEGKTFYLHAIEHDSKKSDAYFRLAVIFLVQNESTTADNYFKKAIDLGGKDTVHYWLHIAAYQSLRNDSDKAAAALRSALKIQPHSYFLKLKIAQLLIVYKRYNALINFFSEFSAFTTESPLIQKFYVEALLNSNQLEKAQSLLQSHELSKDPEWLSLLGKNSLLQGSFSLSCSYFEQVLATHQNDPNAHYMLALAYLAADKINLATRTLIRLLVIYPDMIEAELALATIYYTKGEYDLSIDYLNRIIKKNPEHSRPYIMLGNCMLSTGQYEEAKSNFEKALRLDSKSITGQYFLATAYEKIGMHEEAIQLYRSILAESPDKADVGSRLAELLIREDRTNEAISLFGSIVENHPEDGNFKLIVGNIYFSANQFNNAADYYRLAVEVNPELIEGYIKIAELQTDNTQKISIIRDALKKVPDSIELINFLANIYFCDEKYDLAIELLKSAQLTNPLNPTISNNLAWLYLETDKKLNDAYELALSAFEKNPENPSYSHTLGWALYKKDFFGKAEWQFREALRLIEKNKQTSENVQLKSICSYHLALTLLETKQSMEAIEKLQSAIVSGLPPRFEEHARKLLESMQGVPDDRTSL